MKLLAATTGRECADVLGIGELPFPGREALCFWAQGDAKEKVDSMAANTIVLPKRSEVKVEECWDLASLFASEQEWEKGLKKWEKMIPGYARFKGKLGRSAKMLADCMRV